MKKQVGVALVAGFLMLGAAMSAQAQATNNGNVNTSLGGTGGALSVSPTSLSGFSTSVGKPSAPKKYDLTGSMEHTNITAPDGFEISLQEGSGYGHSVSASGHATIWVRLTGKQAGPVSGSIDIQGSSELMGSASARVGVSGTVN